MTSFEARPIAKMDDLLSTELASGEIIVFDKKRNRAHCLNPSAAAIWRGCDGKRTVKDLAALVSLEKGIRADEAFVWVAITELRKLELLEDHSPDVFPMVGMTRRQAMARVGSTAVTAAALVPLVATVLAPKSSAAASCLRSGAACTVGSQCCSGSCVGSVCT